MNKYKYECVYCRLVQYNSALIHTSMLACLLACLHGCGRWFASLLPKHVWEYWALCSAVCLRFGSCSDGRAASFTRKRAKGIQSFYRLSVVDTEQEDGVLSDDRAVSVRCNSVGARGAPCTLCARRRGWRTAGENSTAASFRCTTWERDSEPAPQAMQVDFA